MELKLEQNAWIVAVVFISLGVLTALYKRRCLKKVGGHHHSILTNGFTNGYDSIPFSREPPKSDSRVNLDNMLPRVQSDDPSDVEKAEEELERRARVRSFFDPEERDSQPSG